MSHTEITKWTGTRVHVTVGIPLHSQGLADLKGPSVSSNRHSEQRRVAWGWLERAENGCMGEGCVTEEGARGRWSDMVGGPGSDGGKGQPGPCAVLLAEDSSTM